jgi:hypothetical protein
MIIYRKYTISTPATVGAFNARIWREDGRRFRIDRQTFEVYETMTRFEREEAIADAKRVVDLARLVPLPKP